jgi:hypothetical protein
LNNPAFAQIAKDTLSFRWIVNLNAHAEALWLRSKLWRRVAAHQESITNLQADVHDTRVGRHARTDTFR